MPNQATSAAERQGPDAPHPMTQPAAPARSGPVRQLLRQAVPLLLWVGLALLLRWAVIEPRWIPSGSMLPTLDLEDRILVEKLRPRLGSALPVGAIVVFRPPDALLAAGYDPSAALIKRVIGVPGDQISVSGGVLWRNGSAVSEPWRAAPMEYRMAPLRVPPGHLLVLGDNRNASLDSHIWGPLPADHVIGTAVFRYWPLDHLGPIRVSPIAGRG